MALLTMQQELYLDQIEDYYDKHGELPKSLRTELMNNIFREAMLSRHLPAVGSDRLTKEQRHFIRSYLNFADRRSIKVKLEEVGATTSDYQQWLKQKHFHDKLTEEQNKVWGKIDIEAKNSIIKLISEGDLNAIKYFHEFTGKYRPNTETNINITIVVAQLMEILVKYLAPQQLESLNKEFEEKVIGRLSN